MLTAFLLALACITTDGQVTIAAAGDIMLGRNVGRVCDQNGPRWLFETLNQPLKNADIAFANLECVLSDSGLAVNKDMTFRNSPALAKVLNDQGFKVLSLANNHTFDYGTAGLLATIQALRQKGIIPLGAGNSRKEAVEASFLERNGVRTAWLSACALPPENYFMIEDEPSIALLDRPSLLNSVKKARQQADVVVVSLHWGKEFSREVTAEQRQLARALIDSGATLVLGHHPHVGQEVEPYRNGLIAYSLGDFIFDAPHHERRDGTLLSITVSRQGTQGWKVIKFSLRDCRPEVN